MNWLDPAYWWSGDGGQVLGWLLVIGLVIGFLWLLASACLGAIEAVVRAVRRGWRGE